MIIFITGASHTGKTALAQKLLEKYKYPYLSIDHLKMGLIRSGNTELTPMDDNELTEYLWPIVREMTKTAIENNNVRTRQRLRAYALSRRALRDDLPLPLCKTAFQPMGSPLCRRGRSVLLPFSGPIHHKAARTFKQPYDIG